MTPRTRLTINLMAVVVLGVVMIGWVLTQIIGPGVVNKPFAVTADFAAGGGVFSDQEVTYRGVLVGRVGQMNLNNDGVSIQLLIDPEWKGEIPADVTAKINSKSAVGEQYVNLIPKNDPGGEFLAEGDEITRTDTALSVDVQDLLASLEGVLGDVEPDKARRLVKTLSASIGGKQSEIKAILESLATLSKTFAEVAPEQQRLLDNATAAGDAFLGTKDAFTEAIRAADEVFAGLGDEPEELEALFAANDKLAREGIELLSRRGDELARGIGSLADFVDYQLQEKNALIQTLDYVPDFLHAVEDSSIPWQSEGGETFYRLRVGLVLDNVARSWPCKYRLPLEYERFHFQREARRVVTNVKCKKDVTENQRAIMDSMIAALEEWAQDEPPAGLADLPISGEGFIWPLDGPITSPYGPRWGRMHTGIDIDGVTGEPVIASAAGTVTMATHFSGYGNAVMIDHGGGVSTLYGHQSAIDVEVGDVVAQGQIIGSVGCTGNCTGDHLHFEIRIGGTPVDPLPYLPGGSSIASPTIPPVVPPIVAPSIPTPPPSNEEQGPPPESSEGSVSNPTDPLTPLPTPSP